MPDKAVSIINMSPFAKSSNGKARGQKLLIAGAI